MTFDFANGNGIHKHFDVSITFHMTATPHDGTKSVAQNVHARMLLIASCVTLLFGSFKAELEAHHHSVCALSDALSSTAISEATCFPNTFRPIGDKNGQVAL